VGQSSAVLKLQLQAHLQEIPVNQFQENRDVIEQSASQGADNVPKIKTTTIPAQN
jgi:hypothetical protein